MAARKTYAAAHEQAQRVLSQAALNDPDSHFPYKADAVREVLDTNPPMGPGNPDGLDGSEDRSREVADYMTPAIAEASGEYVAAQAAFYAEPSDSAKAEYDAARDRLLAARLDHRENRGDTFTIGAAARRAG